MRRNPANSSFKPNTHFKARLKTELFTIAYPHRTVQRHHLSVTDSIV